MPQRTKLLRLQSNVEVLQTLLIAWVTGERGPGQLEQYRDLYFDVASDLVDAGYEDPNPHTSLEAFWSYCKLEKLDTYDARRLYVRELYSDTLLDLARRLKGGPEPRNWSKANSALEQELTPVRRQWLKAKKFLLTQPPDLENSVKESINSVESALRVLTRNPKGTLGQLVKDERIDQDIGRIVSQAYGLLSNRDFVRHGGTTDSTLRPEDAEFFLELAAISIYYLKIVLSDEHKG